MGRHLYLLFLLSGLSGLIYESMWSRYLRLFVGSAATAQILVLALFMGGMSMGALLAGRLSEKIQRPVMIYGVIEGLIGVYALAFPTIYEFATRLCYDSVFPAMSSSGGVGFVKWTTAGLMIFPPCLLLGMTFPLMSIGILRRDREKSGEVLSFLYFTNSFGASMGALLTGFVLVPALGLPNTLVTAAVINFGIMAVALRERKVYPPLTTGVKAGAGERGETPASETSASDEASNRRARILTTLLLATAFGTGLSSFMYEVSWIRMLSMVLGSATHSFEVMLSAFVFGLAIGGLWVRKRMDRFKHPAMVLGLIQLIMGIAAVCTVPLYRVAVIAMGAVFYQDERTVTMWVLFNVVRYLLALLIMLPATFCAGMTLPLLTHVLLRRKLPESVIGQVYGINTLGAIVGAVSAGLFLLPAIGLKNTIVLGGLVDMVLGILILRHTMADADAPATLPKLARSATMATVMVGVIGFVVIKIDPMVLSATVFRKGQTRLHEDYELISHEDGRTATVTVIHDTERQGYFTIFTNGKPDASVMTSRFPDGRDRNEGPIMSGDEPTQILVGMIPAFMKPDAKRWAMIGMGSGVSSDVILASPDLEFIDTVEIEPEMAAGAAVFDPLNRRLLTDPRSNLIFDDAKAHFAGHAREYDVIVSEPSNPWVSGVASLFTVEFYQEIKRYLAPHGIVAQWIQGYELSDDLLYSVLAAVDAEFTDYQIFRIGSRDWVIVATVDGPVPDLSERPLAEWPGFIDRGELLGIHDVAQVEALLVANKRMLHPFLSGVTPNRDAFPILDIGAERARFFRKSAESLLSLRWTPLPLLEVFGGIDRAPYPELGIPDAREDRHILLEPEKANALMRFHATGKSEIGTSEMSTWRQRTDALGEDEATWEAWFHATYEVYNLTASWVDLRKSPWWAECVKQISDPRTPTNVSQGIRLLHTAALRDGPALAGVVNEIGEGDNDLFDPRLVALAGALALELNDSPIEARREFAEGFMSNFVTKDDSHDYAYQVIQAFTADPPPAIKRAKMTAVDAAGGGAETPPPSSPARRWSFEEVALGGPPAGITCGETNPHNHPATWRVVEREDAPSPPHAFGVTACTNPEGAVFEVALMEGTSFGDVEAEAWMRATGGRFDQGGGIIWRALGAEDYYVARWNPIEGNLRIYVVQDSVRRKLAEQALELDPGEWHRMQLVVEGQHFEVSMDDHEALVHDDDSLSAPGMVGLWTKSDALTLFDDFSVTEP